MRLLATVLIMIVTLLHLGFMAMEMLFWTSPVVIKSFSMTPAFAEASRVLAANQGLYNGFLAAGLIWALWSSRFDLKVFFLGCVTIAGIFGGMTAKLSIVFVQALPAILALAALVLARSRA
jgi:putative membrane protein